MASVAFTAVLYELLNQGLIGRHIWDIPVSMDNNTVVQYFQVASILYGCTIFLAKMTILLLYFEIFKINTPTKIMIYIAMFISVGQFLANTIGQSVLCVPKPGESFELKGASKGCKETADLLGVGLSAVSVATDLFILVIPIPCLWRLQLARWRKIGITVIFVTGIFACIASILALYYRTRQYLTQDNTWNASYTLMLCSVEINVTIICSCMPSFASYLKQPFQKLRSLTSRYLYPSRKYNSSRSRQGAVPMHNVEPAQVQDDKMKLTLSSTLSGGKSLHISSQQERRSTSPMDDAHDHFDAEERRPVEV